MPRQPKPWYWKARGAWYVQLNKKQVRLHEDKKQADREFYRIMAAEGMLEPKQKKAVTVADACEAFVSHSQYLRPGSLAFYTRYLGLFAASKFGASKLAEVQPNEVIDWITRMTFTPNKGSDGTTSRQLMMRYVKQLYRWARDSGLSDINQFARTPSPWKVLPRTRSMTPDEYAAIMARPRVSEELREFVEFVWRTGARPGELCILSARHLDANMRIARLRPSEHKTGSRSGLHREIYFPEDLWERLKRYAEIHKTGPLLRRHDGKPWSTIHVSQLFGQLASNMGLDCVLYHARHAYGTGLLESGVPLERAAKMMGHAKPYVLLSTYYHPAAAQMQADVGIRDDEHKRILDEVARKKEEDVASARKKRSKRSVELRREARKRIRLGLNKPDANPIDPSDT